MPANDPQVLTVKRVLDATDKEMDFNFFYRTVDEGGSPSERPARLCGISFFGELGGHDPANEVGLELWGRQDTTHPAAYKCPAGRPYPTDPTPKYGLTYEDYLNALYHNGLCAPPNPPLAAHFNYVRLFLEHRSGQDVHAFQRDPNGKFNLHVVNEKFLNRLAEFVEKARARGVVVCISLTSIQSIKTQGWLVGPFYWKNNNNQLAQFTDGLGTFCKIVRPREYETPASPWPGNNECFDPPYNPAWTPPEKLYFIQHQLFRRVVEKTRGYWNVVYEICNEAGKDMQGVVAWHSTVAKWLSDCLREDLETPRQRLISISAQDNILYDAANPADPTKLVNSLKGQVDFISLHGGQWTNDPPTAANRCNTTPVPTPEVVASKVEAAIKRYRGKGYALLFDADAAYWAQRSPTRYVSAVLRRGGSFNYRWSVDMLTEIVNPDGPAPAEGYCKKVNGNLGLDQRLRLIRAGEGFETKVTAFPLPAAAVPKNLVAAFGAGALNLTFGRPERPPADSQDPDTKPEGYVVLFGATADTVGQGTGPFPPRQYFKVANPEAPSLNIPVAPAPSPRELYVAVAAYNGPFTGARSNVAHVTIPKQ